MTIAKAEKVLKDEPAYNIHTISGKLVVNGFCGTNETGRSLIKGNISRMMIYTMEKVKKGTFKWCYENIYNKSNLLQNLTAWIDKSDFWLLK